MLWQARRGLISSRAALDAAVVVSGSVWGDHGTAGTISTTTVANDTWTAPNDFTSTTARGTQGYSTGIHYVEFEILALASGGAQVFIGLADATTATGAGLDTYLGDFVKSCGTAEGGSGSATGGFSAASISSLGLIVGDILAIVWDATNAFHYLAKNNTWLNSGDPTSGASGTGAIGTYVGAGTLYPAYSVVKNASVKIKTASFTYTPPAGSSAWG